MCHVFSAISSSPKKNPVKYYQPTLYMRKKLYIVPEVRCLATVQILLYFAVSTSQINQIQMNLIFSFKNKKIPSLPQFMSD